MISQTAMMPEENLGLVVLTNSETPVNTILQNKIFDVFVNAPKRDWSGEALERSADTATCVVRRQACVVSDAKTKVSNDELTRNRDSRQIVVDHACRCRTRTGRLGQESSCLAPPSTSAICCAARGRHSHGCGHDDAPCLAVVGDLRRSLCLRSTSGDATALPDQPWSQRL